MIDFRIGTSGWVYDFWVGGFYPSFTVPADYLKVYSKIFNLVEIDNSFYRFPSRQSTKQWAAETPADFVFTAKFHRRITAEKRLTDYRQDLEYLYRVFEPMGEKLRAFVIQLPPNFTFGEGIEKLGRLISDLDSRYRYAVEFRHDSWFRDQTYELLRASKIAMAWSEIPFATNPGVVTTDLIYLRFIGERDIPESQLGGVKRDLLEKKSLWAKRLKDQLPSASTAYVFFNNRFEGFGPGSVNSLRKLVGLSEIDFTKLNLGAQRTLFDFGG